MTAMLDAAKVVSAVIVPPANRGDFAKVVATMDTGVTETVIEYFDDEISFQPEEVIGLTRSQCSDLFRKKDTAYLQS